MDEWLLPHRTRGAYFFMLYHSTIADTNIVLIHWWVSEKPFIHSRDEVYPASSVCHTSVMRRTKPGLGLFHVATQFLLIFVIFPSP